MRNFKVSDIIKLCDRNTIQNSINHLEDWINVDLKEIGDDATSEYAKFILNNHCQLIVAITALEHCLVELDMPTKDCELLEGKVYPL